MTNLEALKNKINYPLNEGSFLVVLIEADINPQAEFSKDNSMKLDIAASDLILQVLTSPNVSEGGYSISLSDREALLKVRSLLLAKWQVDDSGASSISDATYLH
ncbi:MAG: DUF6706 family protein [Pedobacter sp.]